MISGSEDELELSGMRTFASTTLSYIMSHISYKYLPGYLLKEYARLTISEQFSTLLKKLHVINGKFHPAR